MDVLRRAEVNAIILFPMSGPATLEAWTEAAKERDLTVLVGGWMTHPKFLKSQGGYIDDFAAIQIYELAADLGVTNFVVPGNNIDAIKEIRNTLVVKGVDPTLFAPGFVAQGGEITDAGKAAGSLWHAIVGRGIYGASDIKAAALELSGKL
jgi:orotidine-5'-phosphate decarboxylase